MERFLHEESPMKTSKTSNSDVEMQKHKHKKQEAIHDENKDNSNNVLELLDDDSECEV